MHLFKFINNNSGSQSTALMISWWLQKQQLADILQNSCYYFFFFNIHRKTLVWLGFFLMKLQVFIKKRLQHRYFPVNTCEIFKNSFFRTPPVAASAIWIGKMLKKWKQVMISFGAVARRCSAKKLYLTNNF